MKKKWLIMSALVLSLGLTACGDADNDGSVDDTPPVTEEDQDVDVDNDEDTDEDVDVDDSEDDENNAEEGSSSYDEVELTIEDAYAKFAEEKPNTDLEKLELNYDDGEGYTYTLVGNDGVNHQEMKINANNGDIEDVDEKEKERDEEKIFDAKYVDDIDAFVKKAVDETADKFKSIQWDVEIDDEVPTLTVEVDTEDGQVDYVYNLETGELLEENK